MNIGIIDREDIENYLKIINKVKPDIIHIHGTENPFSCLLGAVNIPIVLSIQGLLSTISYKWNSGIEKSYFNKTKQKLNELIDLIFLNKLGTRFPTHYKMYLREEKNLKKSNYIIGRTDWDRRSSNILAPNAQYFHNDEIMRDQFYHQSWKIKNSNKIVIFSTSSGATYKGFELICRTIYELKKVGHHIEWIIAGLNASDSIVKVVKHKLKEKFPQEGLNLKGNLSAAELVSGMLETDVFVMPSHIENGCNALSEAMLLGIPCITTLAGGTGTTLKDKMEGLVIQGGDPWGLAGAILEIKNNPLQACTYAKNAKTTASRRHDKKKILNDLLNIYNKIGNCQV